MKRCHYCGKDLVGAEATVDHLVPIVRGGKDTPENKIPACRSCNSAKGPMTEKEFRRYGPLGGKWPILQERIIKRGYSSAMYMLLALEMANKTGTEEDRQFLEQAWRKMKADVPSSRDWPLEKTSPKPDMDHLPMLS